jgi:hypothetical protein
MSLNAKIVEVNSDNITEHPQAICFINPQNPFYGRKISWLQQQFRNGLKIKLLYLEGEKKAVGFIEYVPGEFCWRAIDAKDYMFVQCLWTNGKKHQNQGLGSFLLNEAEKDARDMLGVVTMTSDKSFMATRDIFTKNGYQMIAESGKDQLMLKQFKKGKLPSINDWQSELQKHRELTMIYSRQCPWVPRFIEEVKPILEKENLQPKIIELKTPAEAQRAPSLYGVFNLIYNGRLLADRYISTTRFQNIINKELKG